MGDSFVRKRASLKTQNIYIHQVFLAFNQNIRKIKSVEKT